MKKASIIGLKKIGIYGFIICLALLIVGCSGKAKDKTPQGETFSGEITIGEELESGKYDINYVKADELVRIIIKDSAGEDVDTLYIAENGNDHYVPSADKEVKSYILKKGYKLSIRGTADFVLVKAMDVTDSASSTEKESSSSSSSSTTESSTTPSSSVEKTESANTNSDTTAAAEEISAKYDEMIEKAQGYVDDPSTYDDMAILTMSADYIELTAKYTELISEADSNTDSTKIFSDLIVKNTKLTELYMKLSK